MSSSVYNHRSLAPNPPISRGGPDGLGRLNDALESVKSEYDVLLNDVNVAKSQRDDAEAKSTFNLTHTLGGSR